MILKNKSVLKIYERERHLKLPFDKFLLFIQKITLKKI